MLLIFFSRDFCVTIEIGITHIACIHNIYTHYPISIRTLEMELSIWMHRHLKRMLRMHYNFAISSFSPLFANQRWTWNEEIRYPLGRYVYGHTKRTDSQYIHFLTYDFFTWSLFYVLLVHDMRGKLNMTFEALLVKHLNNFSSLESKWGIIQILNIINI